MDKKILVIDDDESIIWVIKKALEPLGYKVTSRTRLASGLKAADGDPQLVLLDLILPDGNGLEGLREIRSSNPDIIVIMITANARMESTITAMKEGVQGSFHAAGAEGFEESGL
jgi:DNA-binding NtrC family response regulator